ncbi:MAG: TIR domain-containing protein [Oscillospiraceae bacterium]
MSIYKCKMCGGTLEINEGMTVCECEYCGTMQTLPKTDNEQNLNMINRANHFRQQCEFDKAMEIYERLLNQNNDDAEIYWSMVLCRYGIEYVDDPLTKKKIATCHRTQFKSIFDDADYISALNNADISQRAVYEEEAKYIDSIQKGILEISNKEEPFDVFICYKETDENGRRTADSVLAQELYYQLTQEGFKVFFSRITLEDKLGTAYEPYIFAALNSAKVMVVVGTKAEYFNAVWVKNEWSRYLMIMQEDRSRTLIPAYKDMDPYDLPDALSMFQSQDMSKLGFMQDLIRGIKKIAKPDEPKQTVVRETVAASSNSNVEPILKRMFMFLEDGDWASANEYSEKVLDIEPECADAYLGKLMSEMKIHKREDMKKSIVPFDDNANYQKALRFAQGDLKNELLEYPQLIKYNIACNALEKSTNENEYKKMLPKNSENYQVIKIPNSWQKKQKLQ